MGADLPQPPPSTPPPLPPLEYASSGSEITRPAFLTAIGVISVCLGLIGMAGNGIVALSLPRLLAMSTPPPLPAETMSLPPAPVVTPFTGDLVAANGLPQRDRETIFTAIGAARWSADRQVMLHRMLGEFGKLAFPAASEPAGAVGDGLAEAVKESGALPAGPDGLKTLGTNYLKTAAGAVWVDDAAARFQRRDGAIFRIEHDCAFDADGKVVRSSVAVAEEVNRLHQVLGASFNPVQAAVVAQRILAAGPRIRPGQFRVQTSEFATAHMNGPAFSFGGNVPQWILPDGRTISTDLLSRSPATGLPLPPPGTVTMPFGPGTVGLMALEACVSAVLAVLLVVSGARLLADAPNAARLHLLYAWLKLVTVALGIVLSYWVYQNLSSAGWASTTSVVVLAIATAVNAAYPCVLLRVLRGKQSQRYVQRLGGRVTLFSTASAAAAWNALEAARSSVPWRAGAIAMALVAFGAAAFHLVVLARQPDAVTNPFGEAVVLHVMGALACLASAAAAIAFAAGISWPIQAAKAKVEA